jgi:hypothetical protein
MTDLDLVKLSAFFDEMGNIEKDSVMNKISGIGSNLALGARQIFRNPGSISNRVSKAWTAGKAAAPAGRLEQLWGGIKGVSKVPMVQAGAAGAGVLGAAGLAGFGAGRLTTPNRQY